jgi:hypothetical protein
MCLPKRVLRFSPRFPKLRVASSSLVVRFAPPGEKPASNAQFLSRLRATEANKSVRQTENVAAEPRLVPANWPAGKLRQTRGGSPHASTADELGLGVSAGLSVAMCSRETIERVGTWMSRSYQGFPPDAGPSRDAAVPSTDRDDEPVPVWRALRSVVWCAPDLVLDTARGRRHP